jgi:hypothetical protein
MSWLSGSCEDDDEPGTFIVFEDRPEGSETPPIERGGNVLWVDTGSGPGRVIEDAADAPQWQPVSGEHVERRPSWDCGACGKPWPCDPAREELTAELSPTRLRIHVWMRLEVAAFDMPEGPVTELFERFIHWTDL